MIAMLFKLDGTVRQSLKIELLSDQVVQETRIRHTGAKMPKKTTYPPAVYAPLTGSDKVAELTQLAMQQGYTLESLVGAEGAETYSIIVEIPLFRKQHMVDVIEAFGDALHDLEGTGMAHLGRLDFSVMYAQTSIRLTAIKQVISAPKDSLMLHCIAFASCVAIEFGVVAISNSKSEPFDARFMLNEARHASMLNEPSLERLYQFGVFRRPLAIPASSAAGRYAVSF